MGLPRRHFPLLAAGLAAAGAGAGLAFAHGRVAPIGTGVVVIDTNLGYQDGQAAGTGMVLTSSGEILTNNHVIDGATAIRVVVPGAGRSFAARVVGYDIGADVAVLQLRGASNLATVALGDDSTLTVGEAVTALGNAGGTGSLSSASGTVTGLGKSITASDDAGGAERLTGLVETNAAIEPGDSGGPLLDGAGRVVGMDTAASTGGGYGFRTEAAADAYAIPIGKATSIAKRIEAGKASATIHVGGTAFLGIEVESTGGYGYGAAPAAGGLIAGVVPGGPADTAGLVPGDVITAIGGRTVSSPTAITALLLTKRPGTRIAVRYLDQTGMTQIATVKLGSGPPR